MITYIANALGLPRWAATAALIAMLIGALGLAKCAYDRSVIDRHEAKIEAQVQATASAAAEDAHKAVDQSRSEVEKTNDQARKAAAGGADPLKSGLDRLRQGKATPRPAPR